MRMYGLNVVWLAEEQGLYGTSLENVRPYGDSSILYFRLT